MGKIKMHAIAFDEDRPFMAGSIIKGRVIIDLAEAINVRGVKLKFEGHAHVSWQESETYTDSNNQTRTRTYTVSSRESYLKQSLLLHGIWSGQGNTMTSLNPGRHKFPFRFELPGNLPSSFEGYYGSLKYEAKCNIDIPWQIDPKTKRKFIVRSISDLNLDPSNRLGLHADNTKTLCCMCCESGPISATFSTEQSGFAPGDEIRLFADITNDSNRNIDRTYVDLIMIAHFYAQGRSRKETRKLDRVLRPPIAPGGKDRWTGERLVVPEVPPTGFPYCTIMTTNYCLKLNVDPSGPSLDLEIPFDIKIGTIPLRSIDQPRQAVHPSAPSAPQYGAFNHLNAQASSSLNGYLGPFGMENGGGAITPTAPVDGPTCPVLPPAYEEVVQEKK